MNNISSIIQHYNKEEKSIIMKIVNCFSDVMIRNNVREFAFLNPNEIKMVEDIKPHFPTVEVFIDGGYEGAERKKIVFHDENIKVKKEIVLRYQIKYQNKFKKLEHRHVMGTIINSGIDFNKVGDIIVSPNGEIQIVVDNSIEGILEYLVTNIAKQKVSFIKIPEISIKSQELTEKHVTVSSLRIDIFICKITKLSRKETSELLEKKYVKVNYLECKNVSKIIDKNDIISIRSYGRFEIINYYQLQNGKLKVIYR